MLECNGKLEKVLHKYDKEYKYCQCIKSEYILHFVLQTREKASFIEGAKLLLKREEEQQIRRQEATMDDEPSERESQEKDDSVQKLNATFHQLAQRLWNTNVTELLHELTEEMINQTDSLGRTMLHCAAEVGDLNMMKILMMKTGFNVNEEELTGLTPLGIAVIHNHIDCCEYLIKAGAEIDNVDRKSVV